MNNASSNKTRMRVWVKPTANFPPFAQPMVVSYFSLDQDRKFTADNSQLRYMYLPRAAEGLGWDLSHGLEKVQRADHSKSVEKIDNLLRGLLSSGLSINQEVASFMCLRGLLTKVMTTPYEQNQGWEILVSKFRGVLFMCAQETPEQRRERMSRDDAQKRFCSWGFKFEQYMTTDQPGCPPDIEMPVKEGEEFCCLFRTKLNDRRLLYGAEMDAVTSDVPLEDCLEDLMLAEFIELKTSRKIDCVRQERNFKRFKLLNWWAQNFLVNVGNIICGFRDDRGIIKNLAFYKVDEIPKLAKDFWIPAVCMTFLDQFLTFVQRTVWECPHSNDPYTVWRFRWEPGVHYVTGDVVNGRSQLSFLPEWFVSSVVARENHPLESCIRIHSSKRGQADGEDQRCYTAKVFNMTKDIAVQRARSARPPSPRSIMRALKGSQPCPNPSDNSSVQSNGGTSTAGDGTNGSAATSTNGSANASSSTSTVPMESTPPGSSKSSGVPEKSSHHQTGRHRRRARDEHFSHPNNSHRNAPRNDCSFQSHRQHQTNSRSLQSSVTSQRSESVPEPVIEPSISSSLPILEMSQEQFNIASSDPNTFSPDDLPPTGLSHSEEVVYSSAYASIEGDSFLVPQSSEELSPASSVDQFASSSFLTPSPSGDSYSQHAMLSSPLPSASMMSECYSPHAFSVDELPQATYLVTSDGDYLQQQSQAYMQSPVPVEQMSDRSYLSSSVGVDYNTQPSFMSLSQPDDLHSSELFLNEACNELSSSSLLSPVAITQAYLGSSAEISSEDIQTAEGSLTSLSSAAYLPPPSSGSHLTLQM
ncbi:hypothetical protein ONE63_002739 [Megalurothrips usitatus]|uniref:RAI1-like domain-containing protein n=1 Tax=Megalurothrips usitatus TaxID=439358 RepID=A0AAV7X8J7_9NEOP|nr:hypothetical protein ONE63_002739 [Megalurothrips usitatus]